MKFAKSVIGSAVLIAGGFCQGCQKSEEASLIKASPEFIAEEKAERAAIEAARANEEG